MHTVIAYQLPQPVWPTVADNYCAAKALYRACCDKYGSERWVADEPIIDLIETDLPVWMREGTEEYA